MESEQFRRLRTEAVDAVLYNLLILSDIRFLREGLAKVLARDRAFHVTGTVAHLGEALAILRASPIQIILVDAALPDGLIDACDLAAFRLRHDNLTTQTKVSVPLECCGILNLNLPAKAA